MTLKQERAKAIANTIAMVCRHIGVDIEQVLGSTTKKHHPEHQARRLIWYHLHHQGMRKEQLGRIFNRGKSSIHDGIRYAYFNLIDRHDGLIKILPPIPKPQKPCSTSTPN